MHGRRGVRQYVRKEAIAWRDSLLHDQSKPLHPKTVNKKLALLRAVIQVAIDDEMEGLNEQSFNPFRNTEVEEPKGAKPRIAYSIEQLNALMASPVFAEGARPIAGRGEAAYWLPLLALYTGARLEELGQLRIEDVQTLQDVPFLFLRPEAGSIKTGEERRVPLHPEVLRLGFLEYIEKVKQKGELVVFPLLDVSSRGKRTVMWGKWYGRYLRETLKIEDPRITFHSFRHTFKDACREAGITEEVHDALTGHKRGNVGRSYGGDGFPLGVLAEAVKKISYAGLHHPDAI